MWKPNLGKTTGRRERIHYFQKTTVSSIEVNSVLLTRYLQSKRNVHLRCPSKCLIYSEVSVDGANHARFNNRTIYTLRSFATAWIALLIVGVISAAFCNCSCWNRHRWPCLKYEMTCWRKGLHKYRRDMMEYVADVVLLKSRELTSGGGIPSGELISLEEENSFRMF